jgi:hypothetical protein
MKKPLFLTLSAALLVLGGCASVKLPALGGPPSEESVKRYGPHCEQLGNLKGTPEFEACVKKQQDIYQRK